VVKNPKYDIHKINEMVEAIPVGDRKSIRATAKLLGISNSHLHRIIHKYNTTTNTNTTNTTNQILMLLEQIHRTQPIILMLQHQLYHKSK
jgi:hypothetical protein